MNQFNDIQNTFKGWRRERVLWAVVVIIGLLLLGAWYLFAQNQASAPAPSETPTGTPSPTPSATEDPPFEELPYEFTQSDMDINAPTDESFGIPTEDFDGDPTESPTWFVRPFTTPTNTPRPPSGGGGGNFFPSLTPNRYWTYVAQTGTTFARTGTARARITNTFMAPTRATATAAVRQTSTQAAFQTQIARTPRPSQIAYSEGGSIVAISANLSNPQPAFSVIPNGLMGDWAPAGRTIVFERGGRLLLQTIEITGLPTGDATEIPNQPAGENSQPNWSPNNRWIVFRNVSAGQSYIYRMYLDGTRVQRLTNGLTDVAMPDWSPDSGKIIYISNGDIYTINVNPIALAPVQSGWNVPAVYYRPPFQEEPTATETATATATETATATATETATATVTATETATATVTATVTITPFPIVPTRLTNTSEAEAWPHYAADGKSILYARDNGNWDIYLLTPGNVPPVQALHTGSRQELYPFWSLDSRYKYGFLAGGSEGALDIILVDQYGVETALTSDSSFKRDPVWRP